LLPDDSFPDRGNAALAQWVEQKQFSTTRLRPGYDEREVDLFLDEIRDTFLGTRNPPLTPREVEKARFSTTRLRPGYDEEEVDIFLDEVRSALSG
jgi:DivIVA domain-containing protein